MYGWNVEQIAEGEYVLLNRTRTAVRVSEHSFIDLGEILSKIEEAGVPISFTDGLKEIYFTILRDEDPDILLQGDYKHGVIRISTSVENRPDIHRTFIHELGHYVDEEHDISHRPKVITEKPKSAKFMPDSYARKSLGEYIACGFEVFYCGSRPQRGAFRRTSPKLYNVINYLDRRSR